MVRKFKSKPVDDSLIDKLLRKAWTAPSAGHLQPQEFIIVKDQEVKQRLADAALRQQFVADAPVVIVVCADTRRNAWRYEDRGRNFYSITDGAFASLLILLTAVNEALGACFVGAFDDLKVSKVLGLPEEVRPIGIIPIGHPDERPEAFTRRPLENRVHKEKW